jgi:hypothetical protein
LHGDWFARLNREDAEALAKEVERLRLSCHLTSQQAEDLAQERDDLSSKNRELSLSVSELTESTQAVHNERDELRVEVERLREEVTAFRDMAANERAHSMALRREVLEEAAQFAQTWIDLHDPAQWLSLPAELRALADRTE